MVRKLGDAALEAGVSRIPAHEGCFPTGVGHTIPVRPGEAPLLANRVAGACEWQEAGYGGHVHSCNACVQNIGRKVRQCGCFIASECRASGLTYCLIVVGQDGYAMLGECEYVGGNEDSRAQRCSLGPARTFRTARCSQRRAGERMADCDDRMKKAKTTPPRVRTNVRLIVPTGTAQLLNAHTPLTHTPPQQVVLHLLYSQTKSVREQQQ